MITISIDLNYLVKVGQESLLLNLTGIRMFQSQRS